jgi:N-acyl-D-amino-acid deacylase
MDTNRFETVPNLYTVLRGYPRLSRRRALLASAAALAPAAMAGRRVVAGQGRANVAISEATGPITGEAVPELAVFDRTMTELMARWTLPGGQLAVSKDGRLVLNRGYGLADVEAGESVQPDALFRIASVSKAITAVAILALVDDGMLSLDDRAFPLLDLTPPANASVDPRLADVTIEHLLVHAGGWDSIASLEPQGTVWSGAAALVLGTPQPASAEAIIRFMLGFPLDFDPGSRCVYSNFGYNVLGRIIERVSGQSYEDFTRSRVLAPAGIEAMRLARTRQTERAPGEVRYHGPAGQTTLPSVFPGEGFATLAYGAYYMESLDAHGGWLASAVDLVRFATAVDGQRGASLLAPATVEAMLQTPRPPSVDNSEPSAGLGWDAAPSADGIEWSRSGALVGSNAAWVVRTPDGLALSFVFNSLPVAWPSFFPDAEAAMRAAAAAVQTWPAHDLFAS